MASELRVDKIHNEGGDNDTGLDLSTNDQIVLKTANTTRLTMNATGQTTIVGEGGSTTTSVQQGLVKTWIAYGDTASGGNPAIYDSFNHGSITDNGTGDTSYAYTNNMATAKGYTVSGSFAHASDVTTYVYSAQPKQDDSIATSSCRVVQLYVSNSAQGIGDYDYVCSSMAGDLA